MKQRRSCRPRCASSNAGANLGRLHPRAMGAIGPRQRGEIRVGQRGARDAARMLALLVHADGAVHAVVDDDDDDRQPVLHGGRQFLPGHQEAAVAGEADDRPLGMTILAATAAGRP